MPNNMPNRETWNRPKRVDLRAAGGPVGGRECLSQSFRNPSGDPRTLQLLGLVYAQANRPAEAAEALQGGGEVAAGPKENRVCCPKLLWGLWLL